MGDGPGLGLYVNTLAEEMADSNVDGAPVVETTDDDEDFNILRKSNDSNREA